MRKFSYFILFFLLAFSGFSNATVIDFEQVGIANTYNPSNPVGFDTKGYHFNEAVAVLDVRNGSSYSNWGPALSGNFVALNMYWEKNPITISRTDSGIFNFDGISFNNSVYSTLGYVYIVGYLNGIQKNDATYFMTGSRLWDTIDTHLLGVDAVKIYQNTSGSIIFDNVRVSAVPEPSTPILFVIGFVVILMLRSSRITNKNFYAQKFY